MSQHIGCFSSSSSVSLSFDSVVTDTSDCGAQPIIDTSLRHDASVELLRYMRYAHSVDATFADGARAVGMVRISLNLHYCSWCAKTVGYQ